MEEGAQVSVRGENGVELDILFQRNADMPSGQVGVRPMGPGRFYVTAARRLTDAQITMAIARFVAKFESALVTANQQGIAPVL